VDKSLSVEEIKAALHKARVHTVLMIVSLNGWFHRKISRAARSLSESYYCEWEGLFSNPFNASKPSRSFALQYIRMQQPAAVVE